MIKRLLTITIISIMFSLSSIANAATQNSFIMKSISSQFKTTSSNSGTVPNPNKYLFNDYISTKLNRRKKQKKVHSTSDKNLTTSLSELEINKEDNNKQNMLLVFFIAVLFSVIATFIGTIHF